MLRRFVLAASLLSLTGAVGCAHTSLPQHAEPAARRLYSVGEERFAAGHPEQAVTLWRHAITQLPPTAAYDDLRHKLILRLAYGQIAAYYKLGKLAHLYDARRMLERYIVTHEDLFGDKGDAKTERGEVYEILYEVESRIENPPIGGTPVPRGGDATLVAGATLPGAASVVEVAEPVAAAEPDAPPPTAKPAKKRQRTRKVEDAEGNERVVIVETKERTSVDDPVLKKRLAAWNPEDGLIMTAPGLQPWLPARAYVRIDGFAQRVDGEARGGAHAVAAAVIRAVRPALRACYDGAFARAPADFALAKFEFAVDAEGTVSAPRITGGMVGDPLGDACVLERLGAGKIEDDDGVEPMRVAVRLVFFYDGPVMLNEANGKSVRNDLDLVADAMNPGGATGRRGRFRRQATEVPRGLPAIDRQPTSPTGRR